jgi:D-hydroxyproline dehydrogenase subunit gamma
MPPDLRVLINGRAIRVAPRTTVAAAIAQAGLIVYRRSVRGAGRGPLCGMGSCQECRVTIDGLPDCLSCLVPCAEGMRVETT